MFIWTQQFHLLVLSGKLKIVSHQICLILYICLFSKCHFWAERFVTEGNGGSGLKIYSLSLSFLSLPNSVIVIRHFRSCFNSSENRQMLAPVLLIYGEKKTEWHFFHCLTEYGQVARVKSARDDIQLLVLIQTLVHVCLLPRGLLSWALLLSNRAFQTKVSDSPPPLDSSTKTETANTHLKP